MENKHSILYLDDEEQNLIAFQALLRKDYKVFTTTDAHEATEILARENIAVIFSDQKMPDVSGVEFFENIIHEYPTPVRILLTGHADIEAVIDAINKGQVYRYVSKPWEVGDLKICIENAVEKFQRDADLMIKKSSLEQVQSEMAIATTFNYLYQWMTEKLYDVTEDTDLVALLTKVNAQKQIVTLNELFRDNTSPLMNESRDVKSAYNLIQNVMKSCARIDVGNSTCELMSSNETNQYFIDSSKIIAVILFAVSLSSLNENIITPRIEVIENQEKTIGKMQLISNFDWSEKEQNRMNKLVENLGLYLKKTRGSIQLESITNSIIRITFEHQLK